VILLLVIYYVALVTACAVAVNITKIPWGSETAIMFGTLILGCLTLRRNRRVSALLLFYFAMMGWIVIGRIPSSPDPYLTVPPNNTLVIPKKD
jgi:hypothetical protein